MNSDSEEESTENTEPTPTDEFVTDQPAVESSEATAVDSETRITRIDPPEEGSVLERVGTHVVTFGMLGLLAAGTIYVARNVNLPKEKRAAVEQADTTPTLEVASLNPATQTTPSALQSRL